MVPLGAPLRHVRRFHDRVTPDRFGSHAANPHPGWQRCGMSLKSLLKLWLQPVKVPGVRMSDTRPVKPHSALAQFNPPQLTPIDESVINRLCHPFGQGGPTNAVKASGLSACIARAPIAKGFHGMWSPSQLPCAQPSRLFGPKLIAYQFPCPPKVSTRSPL